MQSAEFIENTNKAYHELKRRLDSTAPGNKDAIEKIQDELDALEEINQKFVKEQTDYTQTDQFKSFVHFVRTGNKKMIETLPELQQKQLMRTDVGTNGGFLVPEEWDRDIRNEIYETSNVRSMCRVKTMESKTLNVPVSKADAIIASFEGEAEVGGEGNQAYKEISVTPSRQTVTIQITQDLAMDAGYDIVAELVVDVARAFAQNEGAHHVAGDGVKKPEGFAANAVIQAAARETETALTMMGTDVLKLIGDIKEGYEGVFVFNRAILRMIRTLKDGRNYVFQPAFAGVTNSVDGSPYLVSKDMQGAESLVAGTYPVAYGDFSRGYEIFDRTGTMMIRDVVTKKGRAIIELTFHRWTTGRVVIPEAIALLKVKA